ncbi:cytochrome P450 704C1 [Mercurialis annua]|uniref:cytochrome P450 704C1 n=1 Tax=Mercurialis annua TaxID=3986 RepID=UPI00215E7415|nr:cytochrome P450 704C1 [Mercurialis annua]
MDIFFIIFTLTAAPFLLILLTFLYVMLKVFTGKSINNPNYAPVIGTVFNQLFHFSYLYDHQSELAKTYKTYRLLGPEESELYTTDVKNIEHVLKTNFHKFSKGKYNQSIITDLFGEGIFAVDGEKWRKQRKLSSFEFSTRVLRDFSCSVFRNNGAKLVKVVSKIVVADRAFDMQDILMRCTLDSIFKVGFGVELNCLEGSSKEGTGFMKAFDDSNELVYWRYVDPFWKLKRLFNVGSEASLKKNIKTLDDFVNNLIKTRRNQLMDHPQQNVKEDILSRFLVESEKDPENMNDKYLRDIILNFMIAGKDTSANTLSWFFYMLCKNPLIQEKVAQEVRQVTSSQDCDLQVEDFMAKITDTELEQMHYLHATLTETLRLYPAVPVDGRSAEEDDVLPDGIRMKKGDGLYYMAYAMGRMPYIWGQDAEEFRPERWLNNGIFQPESPFKFVAFHAGPRICLGKDFAYRQMKILSMALLRFFRFKLDDDTTKVTYRTMFTLHINQGLHLQAIPRTTCSLI